MNAETKEHSAGPGCDAADLPQASCLDHPADHLLEAFCPKCDRAVDAVCPTCKTHVESGGAPAAGPETGGGGQGSEFRTKLTPAEFYRRFVSLIQTSRNSKFTSVCYLIATGDAYADGVSMTEVAKHWGVTKAAVSKHCRLICGLLAIAPSQYMRKEETAAKFKVSNRRPVKLAAEIPNPKSQTPRKVRSGLAIQVSKSK